MAFTTSHDVHCSSQETICENVRKSKTDLLTCLLETLLLMVRRCLTDKQRSPLLLVTSGYYQDSG